MGDDPVRVLLVEDDEEDYQLTRDLFAELPSGAYNLEHVADGNSALEAFDDARHDLYLIDYRLGSHTGLELIAEAIRRGCLAPMIMLTGQRDRELDLQAMQAGAVDYLVKDQLHVTALERSMRYALQQKRHQDAIRQVNQELERRVEERTAQLAEVNKVLEAEIAERTRVENQLREADRAKDRFLATLAHELRNPLAPLTTATQLIGLEPEKADQIRELASVMARQLAQLVRLIDDLLDVSRISGGKLQLRKARVSLGEPIAAALESSQPIIDAAGHTLRLSLPPDLPIVDVDPARVTQIISNLLINAAKYTPPGGVIELTVQVDGTEVAIRVRDSGVGIPLDKQSEIFVMFNQIDIPRSRADGGLGIGLALAQTLAEMHGGSIGVFSQGPGTGSEFTVRLPVVAGPGEKPRLEHPPPVLLPDAAIGYRVLVVDDNESAAYLLARLLEKLGQTVKVAHSAESALAWIPQFRPQVMISDLGMPGISGIELARCLRARADCEQLQLIALSGYSQESDRQEALAAGFSIYLTKPIGLAKLKQLLGQLSLG